MFSGHPLVPVGIVCSLLILFDPGSVSADDAKAVFSADELIEILAPEAPGPASVEAKGRRQATRGLGGIRIGGSAPSGLASTTVDRESEASGAPELSAPRPRQGFTNILFATGSSTIVMDSRDQLDEIGKALQVILSNRPAASFVIEGHTDDTGDERYNERLSLDRAESIRTYLVENFEIDEERLTAIGYGERRPIASNDSADERERNRRVEIVGN